MVLPSGKKEQIPCFASAGGSGSAGGVTQITPYPLPAPGILPGTILPNGALWPEAKLCLARKDTHKELACIPHVRACYAQRDDVNLVAGEVYAYCLDDDK
jgi:hypothetical protein